VSLELTLHPDKTLSAADRNWEVRIDSDLRVGSCVSLLKAAHLALFDRLGYGSRRSDGIDLAEASTQKLGRKSPSKRRYLTMGCGDECPYVPGANAATRHSRIQKANPSRKCVNPGTESAVVFRNLLDCENRMPSRMVGP
jgi:hypothetical protein